MKCLGKPVVVGILAAEGGTAGEGIPGAVKQAQRKQTSTSTNQPVEGGILVEGDIVRCSTL